jgi:HSP20 family protein
MAKQESKELVKPEATRSLSPFSDVERWFDDFFRRPFSFYGLPRLRFGDVEEILPSMDMYEDKGDLVLKAELPGMNKEDIEVTLTDSSITISGEKKKEDEVKKHNYYKMERSYGSFSRSFSLPAEVQADKVTSKFKDGVLEIRLPKSEQAKSKEVKIQIQ